MSEVVVTAERRQQSIQQTPLSVVAKTNAQLQLAGVTNLFTLQRIAPNLGLTTTAQYAGTSIRMRGLGTSSNSGIDPDVAPYLDGVYMPRPGALLTSFLDVSTVEVLRGPQGTLFGRSSSIGALLVRTTEPSFAAATGSIQAQAGTYGERKLELIGNQPIGSDFAIRAAGFLEHTDGFVKNSLDGHTYGRLDVGAGRLSAHWRPRPDLTWLLRADYAQTRGDGVNPTPVITNSVSPARLATFVSKLGGVQNAPSLRPTPSFNSHQKFDPGLNDRQWGVNSTLEWSPGPGGITVRLIDSYRNWANDQNDGDYLLTALDVLKRSNSYRSQAQSHELQLLSPRDQWLGGRLNLTAGVYGFSENYRIGETFDIGPDYCDFLVTVRPALVAGCRAGPTDNAAVSRFTQTATSIAGYAQADIRLIPDVTLTLGARDTADHKTGSFREVVTNSAATLVRAAENERQLEVSGNQPTWRAGVTWRPRETVTAFVTYSTGYKSGGFNSSGGSSPLTTAKRQFRPETSADVELGLKSEFLDHRLLFNGDLFQTDIYQFQDRSFDGAAFVVRNAGNIRARGAELEIQAILPAGFQLDGAGAYLDSIFTKNPNAPSLPGCTGAAGSCPTVQNLTGRPNTYAPRWQGNLGLEYDSPAFAGGFTIQGRVDVTYVSGMFTTTDDNPQAFVSQRTLLGARLNVFSPDKSWTLSLFGENLTDARYFTTKFGQPLDSLLGVRNSANGHTLIRGYLGAPLTAGGSITKTF